MRVKGLLNVILADEALTRGLGDAEARILIEWLTDWVETIAEQSVADTEALARVEMLRRRGRAIRQFVDLWCREADFAAATQLAASERFRWALPRPTPIHGCSCIRLSPARSATCKRREIEQHSIDTVSCPSLPFFAIAVTRQFALRVRA